MTRVVVPAGRPNVVVFLTDQQRFDTAGIHGNPHDLTPNLDRMAARGTHLANFFTCQPVCGPARACLQTGRYQTETGCWNNSGVIPDDRPTLASLFRDGGYDTGHIGKWHLGGGIGAVAPEHRGGYEYWLAANALEFTSTAYSTEVFDADGSSVRLPGYRADALVDAAIRWIAQPRDRPFFLFLSMLEPHHQNHDDDYPAPDGYRERYQSGAAHAGGGLSGPWMPPDLAALGGSSHQHLAGYYGMVKRNDEALGRMLDALKSLGRKDDAIVFFTSDHGCHFKTRNAEYKRSPHESSIRIPAVASGPGFTGGGRIDQLISLIDLPPTLLDAAGLEVPSWMQGTSATSLLCGDTAGWRDEVFIQISESQVGRALRTSRWKYAVVADGADGWESPDAEAYREDCLYDLEHDPYELENLAGLESHAGVSAQLRQRLIARMVEAGERGCVIDPAPVRPSGGRAVNLADARAQARALGWE